jgi:uncharacterized membrane protein YfcA
MNELLLFLAAGVVGGAVNAAAGGAKLFVFPLLLGAGLPPLMANATGTVALWPAHLPAVWVYRRELAVEGARFWRRAWPVLIGALTGAFALIASSEAAFVAIVPFCLALAVGAILAGNRLPLLVRRWAPGGVGVVLTAVLLFLCGVYGGYFGAGMGFMLLAVLTLAGSVDMQTANAQKNLLSFSINTTAVVPLSLSGLVDWRAAVAVLVGGLIGGYFGATLTRLIPQNVLRWGVGILGVVLTLSFLLR